MPADHSGSTKQLKQLCSDVSPLQLLFQPTVVQQDEREDEIGGSQDLVVTPDPSDSLKEGHPSSSSEVYAKTSEFRDHSEH